MKLTAPWVVLLLFGSLVGGIVLIALHEAVLGASIVTPTLLLIGEVVRSQLVQIKEAKKKTAVANRRADAAEIEVEVLNSEPK